MTRYFSFPITHRLPLHQRPPGTGYLHLLLRIGVQAQYKCAGYRLAATVHTGGDRQRAIGTDCRETGRNGNHAVITGGSDLHLLALTGGLERKSGRIGRKCCVPLP